MPRLKLIHASKNVPSNPWMYSVGTYMRSIYCVASSLSLFSLPVRRNICSHTVIVINGRAVGARFTGDSICSADAKSNIGPEPLIQIVRKIILPWSYNGTNITDDKYRTLVLMTFSTEKFYEIHFQRHAIFAHHCPQSWPWVPSLHWRHMRIKASHIIDNSTIHSTACSGDL